ncbi:unnamed protein product [Brassicogethes aeneus]|uniref:Dynein assembly factor 3, axonemal n=1 Tax=Brassicogethes aeneus TaxID=1431903 RepID=A0A9P0B6J8_BRAAE|nr:unnamed protein product [Brassicogethes aeneus]
MFWGLTSALDLLAELEKHNKNLPEVLNILIIGGADGRHVLQTVAKRYRHSKVVLNFYLIEKCGENLAKQLLLLNIALQPDTVLGLEQKTKLFMELYGNSMVRPSVAKYLTSTALELVKMVTNYDYLSEQMNFLKLEIKYKERDYLENLLKFWCGKDEFNICDSWDKRLRKNLGVRYDAKLGAFDWDLHMRLHTIGGNQVCNQEYRNFRLNGVAFTWLESEVSKPNRSMVCAVIPNGENYIHHGYLGDMQTGPFVSFGLSCEDEEFLKSQNGRNSFRSTDVTERNLKQIFWEILNQKEYIHEKISDYMLGTMVLKQEKLVVDVKNVDVIPKRAVRCIELDNVKITFLSVQILEMMKFKEEYKDLFDLVYFGTCYMKHFSTDLLENISKSNTLLMIEHQLFVLSKRKKDLQENVEDLNEKTKDLNWEKLPINPEKDNYIKLINK